MEKRWILLTDNYTGLEKEAVNTLYSVVSGYLKYVLPVKAAQSITHKELSESNIILVGKLCTNTLMEECQKQNIVQVPKQDEGYSVYVGEGIFCPESQMIVIAGYDAAGVLYGCMDFCNKYLGNIIYQNKDIFTDATFEEQFYNKLNTWQISSAPAIKRRAIWTWGHVIYDYRKFFENMAKLRLNEVVIWNDVAPLNAKDVVEYAHSLNIKVIWGFSWGWGTSCKNILEQYDERTLAELKRQVLEVYELEYAQTGCDGIYFQSFTELHNDYVDGKCVAELVTQLVNDIAGSLFNKYPGLHIQFGLHATSVRNQLEHIKNVDKRIYIVWEDCGSFPYHYYADRVADFDETLAFTEKTLCLRGDDEKWGAVFKGMLKLDWGKFEHFSAPYILGQRTISYIKERQTRKNKIWRIQQSYWLKNAEYIRQVIEKIVADGRDTVVQALVEDSVLENEIMFPLALYAEMLWEPNENSLEMIEQVSKYPCVNFSNI